AAIPAWAQEATHAGEAGLIVPPLDDTSIASFMGSPGVSGKSLLLVGLLVSALGMGFGLWIYTSLKNAPVHESMREISELIYETCKTYLITQMRFVAMLWAFIAAI